MLFPGYLFLNSHYVTFKFVKVKNSRIISTQDLKDKGDLLHFNSKGQRTMGKRFAKEYLKTL